MLEKWNDEQLDRYLHDLEKKHEQLKLIVTNNKWAYYASTPVANRTSGVAYHPYLDMADYDCANIGVVDSKFIAPERGIYLVHCQITWYMDHAGYIFAYFGHTGGGTSRYHNLDVVTVPRLYMVHLHGMIPMDAGDYVQPLTQQVTGVNTPDLWGSQTPMLYSFMEVHLLSRRCF